MNFFIINDFDKPYEKLVMVKDGDLLRYIHPENKSCSPVNICKESTDLKEFGFDIFVVDGIARFVQSRPSTATYRDGKPRSWQGAKEFEIIL